jgi:hypothetical protein
VKRIWQQTTTNWSNGASQRSPVTDWTELPRQTQTTVQTLDPTRIWGTTDAGTRWDAGTVDLGQNATGQGQCGLTGTLMSCLAQSTTEPVGGGCANRDHPGFVGSREFCEG